MAEPANATAKATLAATATAIAAFAAKVSTSASAAKVSAASAAAVPRPTGYRTCVHQHVFCLLLQWVLRTLHVLRGPKC